MCPRKGLIVPIILPIRTLFVSLSQAYSTERPVAILFSFGTHVIISGQATINVLSGRCRLDYFRLESMLFRR
ncbi:hypothetical protein IW261DRAFT_1467100 [Armillaria novae-zelandiae]|uniref:Uncharacterized protein n=1 Tax=Armillaria novae-zelandiae TaxID=153914 RepID=A0AA39UAM0_9AGAR|nr:hypothetical protein IW261DRAFT_1467100 [Armillaria novae-zelandiae]